VLRFLLVGMLLALPASAEPMAPGTVQVLDGDTVRAHGVVYRLVGFDTPETALRARCPEEKEKGNEAFRRLRQLIDRGDVDLTQVPCSCRAGTEGTPYCNRGRSCACSPWMARTSQRS
jgi:hypothetical protein